MKWIILPTFILAVLLYSSFFTVVTSQHHVFVQGPITLSHEITQMTTYDKIDLKVNVDTHFSCQSICQTNAIDLDTNEIIDGPIPKTKPGAGKKLIQIDTQCNIKDTLFCDPLNENVSQKSVIAFKYNRTQEENIQVSQKQKIEEKLTQLNTYGQYRLALQENHTNLDEQALISYYQESWEQDEYKTQILTLDIPDLTTEYETLYYEINLHNTYAFVLENLTIPQTFKDYYTKYDSENKTLIFNAYRNLSKQENIVESVRLIENQIELLQNDSCYTKNNSCVNATYFFDMTIPKKEPKHQLPAIEFEQIFLPNVTQKCCFNNECQVCEEPPTPILFIHGHSFHKDSSPVIGLNSFSKIQNQLNETHINAGFLERMGEIGIPQKSFSTRASFYYTRYYDFGTYSLSLQSSDRIENYAIRLNEIIREIKQQAGVDKVIIVSHSMGGLVARSYLQLFSSDSVEKLITINTPHNGLTNQQIGYCGLLGSQNECDDMRQGSTFFKKLQNQQFDIPVVAYYSIGCVMDGTTGDGVVTQESAMLPNALNIELKRECTGVLGVDLHSDILKDDDFIAQLKHTLNK